MEQKRLAFKDFLAQYSSPSTKKTYKSVLLEYLRDIYPILDAKETTFEVLDNASKTYLGEIRDFQDDVQQFADSLGDEIPPKSRQLKISAVFSWLDSNGHEFPKKWKRNLLGKSSEALTLDKVPTRAELGRIVQYMNLENKIATLFLASSGLRIGELLRLRISDLEMDHTPVVVHVMPQTKTGRGRTTFVTDEVKQLILEFLKNHTNERLFTNTKRGYQMAFTEACDKTELGAKDGRTNRRLYHIHSLRKFFESVPWTVEAHCQAMTGHQSRISKDYKRFPIEELAKTYLLAETYLTVLGNAEVVQSLKGEVKERDDAISTIKQNLELKVMTLENQLHELREQHKTLAERLGFTDKDVEVLRGIIYDQNIKAEIAKPKGDRISYAT